MRKLFYRSSGRGNCHSDALLKSMRRIAIVITLLLIFFATTVGLPVQQDEGRFAVAGLKEREVELFFNSFKDAVARNDKHKVATMVSFPIKV